MNRNQVIENIKILMREKINISGDSERKNRILQEVESLIRDYLKISPHDSQMWLRLGLTYLSLPWFDHPAALESLEKAHEIDPSHVKILLCLAYTYELYMGSFDQRIFQDLLKLKTNDLEELSMIEFMKALYFSEINDYLNYEKSLRKSVEFWQGHFYNLRNLAAILSEVNPDEAQNYINMAQNNLRIISRKQYREQFYDRTDVENFLDEYIRGIYKIDESTLK